MTTFKLTFKTPDVMDDLQVQPEEREEAEAFAKKYVRWGEYVTIEFDTDAKTATVLEAKS